MSCQSTLKGFVLKLVAPFAAVLLLLPGATAFAEHAPARLVFTGDILLSREVQREISLKGGRSPWSSMEGVFKGADWVMGNLEGAIGEPSQCPERDRSLCFATSASLLAFPKQAGFTALGVENNHSADLGHDGRKATREEVTRIGLSAISYDQSPGFFRSRDQVFSFIVFTNVPGRDRQKVDVPSNELRQKLRLARSLSDWVIVSVHWGAELADWTQPEQREMAKWLIDQGADLIIGHHPHVIQAPECIQGKPVFFSLGNHVFDQKYPATKQGLMADCTAHEEQLSCSGVTTTTPAHSSFPEVSGQTEEKVKAIASCRVRKSSPLVINGYSIRPRLAEQQYVEGEVVLEGKSSGARHWNVAAKRLLSLEKGRLAQNDLEKDFLFTLEAHPSSIDKEVGPRPYVYEVTPRGLIARWRGSALAWPLLDGKLIRAVSKEDVDHLCALHRKDSFIALNADTQGTRTAVYKWNGFGFSGVSDPTLNAQCESAFN